MNIKTENQATQVWVAYDDDTYDGPGSTIGWGETREAAIADFLERLQDKSTTAELGKRIYELEWVIKLLK